MADENHNFFFSGRVKLLSTRNIVSYFILVLFTKFKKYDNQRNNLHQLANFQNHTDRLKCPWIHLRKIYSYMDIRDIYYILRKYVHNM